MAPAQIAGCLGLIFYSLLCLFPAIEFDWRVFGVVGFITSSFVGSIFYCLFFFIYSPKKAYEKINEFHSLNVKNGNRLTPSQMTRIENQILDDFLGQSPNTELSDQVRALASKTTKEFLDLRIGQFKKDVEKFYLEQLVKFEKEISKKTVIAFRSEVVNLRPGLIESLNGIVSQLEVVVQNAIEVWIKTASAERFRKEFDVWLAEVMETHQKEIEDAVLNAVGSLNDASELKTQRLDIKNETPNPHAQNKVDPQNKGLPPRG